MRSIILLAALGLAACVASPPSPKSVEVSGKSPLAADAAWSKLADWIASKGGHLTGSDKATGAMWADIPVADKDWNSLSGYADCGELGMTFSTQATSNLQATLAPDDAGTSLKFAARYSEIRQNTWPGTIQTVNCNSTGRLEHEALAALQ